MYILLQMQEIGIFLLKTAGILVVLFWGYILILIARELWRDKAQELEQPDIFTDDFLDKMEQKDANQIHREITAREKAVKDLNIRKVLHFRRNWEKDCNNYRKMHGMPLVRRGGENYGEHINRKLKRRGR